MPSKRKIDVLGYVPSASFYAREAVKVAANMVGVTADELEAFVKAMKAAEEADELAYQYKAEVASMESDTESNPCDWGLDG